MPIFIKYVIYVKFINIIYSDDKYINIIAIAAIWFAYTNWGTALNLDKAVDNGTSKIKTEKSIDKVVNSRQNIAKDNQEMLDKI